MIHHHYWNKNKPFYSSAYWNTKRNLRIYNKSSFTYHLNVIKASAIGKEWILSAFSIYCIIRLSTSLKSMEEERSLRNIFVIRTSRVRISAHGPKCLGNKKLSPDYIIVNGISWFHLTPISHPFQYQNGR